MPFRRRQLTDLGALHTDGFTMLRDAVPVDLIARLDGVCDAVPRAGIRNLFDAMPDARDIVDAGPVRDALRHMLGKPFVTRAILFDKATEENWSLPYHQDTVIAVDRRVDGVRGYGPWSVKQGVIHVQPPAVVLESMLTVRVHLDDADEHNGALMVLPATHKEGILEDDRIRELRSKIEPVLCAAKAGDALLMRPLTLHASSRSTEPNRRRRVVHLEFASSKLPGGMQWARP